MLITYPHIVLCRLEYSDCREALTMDPSRFRNRDRTQKLRGCKSYTVLFVFCFFFRPLWLLLPQLKFDHRICECIYLICLHICAPPPSSSITLITCVHLQALVQELNFSAYLGLPVFMIPINGPHNANLARLLLNHIHTGHHTSNVRHARPHTTDGCDSLANCCHSLWFDSVLDTSPSHGYRGHARRCHWEWTKRLHRWPERRWEDLELVSFPAAHFCSVGALPAC